MAKSTSGTKNLKEALTPDQVSKVEDKYKSIYSGMLKGNKKKLMKYIDPKLKRPNPDAMAMGRAINLVKKETETETINEGLPPGYGKFLVSLQMLITDIAPNAWGNKSQIRRGDVKRIHNSLKKRYGGEYEKFNNLLKTQSGPLGNWYLQETVNESSPELDKIRKEVELIAKKSPGKGWTKKSIDQEINRRLQQFLNREYVNEVTNWPKELTSRYSDEYRFELEKVSPTYQDKPGRAKYRVIDIESGELKGTPIFGKPEHLMAYADDLIKPQGGTQSSHFGESLNEDNSYDSFKTDASERFLNRSQVVELLPVLKNSLNKLNFSPSKQPTLSVKRYGLSSSNKGYVISMYIPTSKDDIIVELGKYPKDDKTDEVSISLYLPNEEGRLTQVAYETSTLPKGEELAEDSNVLSKVISMANQWYEKPNTIDERLATLVKEVYSEKQRKWACSQDGPEFDEMCKDTAISKKKLEEGIDFVKVASYFGMSYPEFYSKSPKVRKEMVERYKKDNTSLKEERTSTVSKARAKSELKQMLKGKRDDGMGKSTLKAVLAIDKDGKETKVKKLEDFDKFEKGTKFSLKETTMNNDRLTELIKAALTGPVKEDNFHSPRTVKNIPIGDEDKDLTTVDLDWYEKKDKERREKAGADMRKNQNSLKEGVWSMGTVTEINRFIKDIKEMKNHYYDIVGSDDVFDGLDRAERAAEELAMNAPENRGDLAEKKQRPDYPDIDGDGDTKEPMAKAAKDKEKSMNEELATTPIKDDIYAIGSRIYKDPYEAISLVATDQTVVVRDFARKDKKFKAAVMDYVKSNGLETSVDRDGLYIDTKPLDFKGMPLMNEKSLAESIFKKLRG